MGIDWTNFQSHTRRLIVEELCTRATEEAYAVEHAIEAAKRRDRLEYIADAIADLEDGTVTIPIEDPRILGLVEGYGEFDQWADLLDESQPDPQELLTYFVYAGMRATDEQLVADLRDAAAIKSRQDLDAEFD